MQREDAKIHALNSFMIAIRDKVKGQSSREMYYRVILFP